MAKVFITKFAISRGIMESAEGEIQADGSFLQNGSKKSLSKKEYSLNLEEATQKTKQLVDDKVKRLKKAIKKLEDTEIKLITVLV